MELSDDIRQKAGKLFSDSFDHGKHTYLYIQEITDSILNDYYNKRGEKLEFPIKIREIVQEFGIEIVEIDLNVDRGFRFDRINGYLDRIGKNGYHILLEYRDSEFTKRYVLAHELSHFIIKQCCDGSQAAAEHCVDPMLPKKWEELVADVMAAFFVLPPRLLLHEMNEYYEWMKATNNYPVDAVQMLRKIGIRTQISTYHMFMNFQYVKYYLCYIYNLFGNGNSLPEEEKEYFPDEEKNQKIRDMLEKYDHLFK